MNSMLPWPEAESSRPTWARKRVAFPPRSSRHLLGAWVPTPCWNCFPAMERGLPTTPRLALGAPQPEVKEFKSRDDSQRVSAFIVLRQRNALRHPAALHRGKFMGIG